MYYGTNYGFRFFYFSLPILGLRLEWILSKFITKTPRSRRKYRDLIFVCYLFYERYYTLNKKLYILVLFNMFKYEIVGIFIFNRYLAATELLPVLYQIIFSFSFSLLFKAKDIWKLTNNENCNNVKDQKIKLISLLL